MDDDDYDNDDVRNENIRLETRLMEIVDEDKHVRSYWNTVLPAFKGPSLFNINEFAPTEFPSCCQQTWRNPNTWKFQKLLFPGNYSLSLPIPVPTLSPTFFFCFRFFSSLPIFFSHVKRNCRRSCKKELIYFTS